MPEFGQRAAERAREARRLAYQREADPLFFAWQAGEASKADWLAKRREIRARVFSVDPSPEDSIATPSIKPPES
jgi:hypothetical protein